MNTRSYSYQPDYAVPPGWILLEHIETLQMSQSELARRCGRSKKLISEIVAGKAKIEPLTALQLQRVLGVDSRIWLGLESDYRLHLEREAETRRATELMAWAKRFPVKDLYERGFINTTDSIAETIEGLLTFFGVGSKETWEARNTVRRVAYRHSPSFKSDQYALAAWLRIGEIEADMADIPAFNESAFRNVLRTVRESTSSTSKGMIAKAATRCAEAGVVLAIVKPIPGTALSGAAWWHNPRKPVIQLSGRHMRDDHLWFSLFHEAAHIIRHSKSEIFVHENKDKDVGEIEEEANDWAADFLIPRRDWDRFTGFGIFTRSAVAQFANQQEIAPGIVVGRLQHERYLDWSQLNGLKRRLQWVGSSDD